MLVTQEFTVKVDGNIILDDLHIDFGPGIHIVMGPNGVGKSTFAHALMGNPKYQTEGAVQIDGKDLLCLETYERAQAGLFLSFQHPTPIQGLSNFQFLRQAIKTSSISNSLSTYRELLSEFKLPEGFERKSLNVEASGGEQKKNEIIQMLMLDPKVAILDEPDSGLDVDAINVLSEQLTSFANRENKTLIVITHYQQLIEKLSPQSITIFKNKRAKQFDDISIAYEILENGFGIDV